MQYSKYICVVQYKQPYTKGRDEVCSFKKQKKQITWKVNLSESSSCIV